MKEEETDLRIIHTVSKGETINDIAFMYETTSESIQNENNSLLDDLKEGQEIFVSSLPSYYLSEANYTHSYQTNFGVGSAFAVLPHGAPDFVKIGGVCFRKVGDNAPIEEMRNDYTGDYASCEECKGISTPTVTVSPTPTLSPTPTSTPTLSPTPTLTPTVTKTIGCQWTRESIGELQHEIPFESGESDLAPMVSFNHSLNKLIWRREETASPKKLKYSLMELNPSTKLYEESSDASNINWDQNIPANHILYNAQLCSLNDSVAVFYYRELTAQNEALRRFVRIYEINGSTLTQMGDDIISSTNGDDFMGINALGNIIVIRAESGLRTFVKKYDKDTNSWKELGDTSPMDSGHSLQERLSFDGTRLSVLKLNPHNTSHLIEIWKYDELPHDPASTPTPTNAGDFGGSWSLEKTIDNVSPGYELDGNDLKIMLLNKNFSPFDLTVESSLNIEEIDFNSTVGQPGIYSQIGDIINDGNSQLYFSNNQDNTPSVLTNNVDFLSGQKGDVKIYEYDSSQNKWIKSICDFEGEKIGEWFGFGQINDKRNILGTQSWQDISVITYKSDWRDEIISNSAPNKTFNIDSSFTSGPNAHFKLEGEHRLEPIYSSGPFSKTTPHIVVKVGDTLNIKNLSGFPHKLCIKDVPTQGETGNFTSGAGPQLATQGNTISFTPSEKGVYFYLDANQGPVPFSIGKIIVI